MANAGLADCGVLAAHFAARAFHCISPRYFSLETMRANLEKRAENGTVPGNVVKFLSALGLNPRYYSSLPWSLIARMKEEEAKALCDTFNRSVYDPAFPEMLTPEAVLPSAKYLTTSGRRSVHVWNGEAPQELFTTTLANNGLVILIVSASHYIVLTESGDQRVTYYDPIDNTRLQTAKWDQILDQWALQNPEIQIGNRPLRLSEAILVCR